ncbi:ADP-ribosylation factor-like protein 11 [Crassostrea virginica]
MGGTCSGASVKGLPKKILIVGNSGAGKTHLLYSWLLGRGDLDPVPTDSFNVERVTSDGGVYMMWDLCGRMDFRLKRRQFFHGTDGVVYVIDPSSDADDAVKDLITVATDRDLSVVPFLILISQRQDVKTDWIVKVQTALKTHKSSTHIMGVDIINQKSIANALSQLDKMFTPANGLHS